ncbi:Multidrug resistance-associated protein 5 [Orchesella cincta]|uniref:Multidrug resistance-associated protein 5 n=1 Tax=Orchesella cincta TaxID=48709 RepID=A0A1D2NAI3_ORCCI|nr:Multidrug resistance-associated protein 5 [Orchesella cincta]
MLLTSLVYIISLIFGFISPTLIMKNVIALAKDQETNKIDGMAWVGLLIFCELGRVFFITLTWAMSYRTAYRLKAASMGLVYRKLLRIGNLTDQVSSKLLNVISGDCGRLYEVIVSCQVAIGGPIVLVMCAVYIWYELGWLPLAGLAVFPLAYPLQYFLAKGSGSLKRKAIQIKDERVSLISQALQHFKFLKMFGWESYLYNTISDVRERERTYLLKSQIFQSLSIVIGPALPHIAAISTFLLYITTGKYLLPAQAFTLLFVFSLLFFSIRMLNSLYESWYSFRICSERIKSLLVLPEIKDTSEKVCDTNHASLDEAIVIEELNLVRRGSFDPQCSDKDEEDKDKRKEFKNINSIERLLGNSECDNMSFQLGPIDLHVKKGSFLGICGYVGSGKTTLLETIAGALTTEKGTLHVFGRTAYVPQHPWLFKGTIRENIVFGEAFDSVRYYNCIESCCLINDFGALPLGDLTRVNNSGSNLSGGQRQRISLARSLYYQNAEIYLLDDPLSGLDNRVGRSVFENSILNKLRKQKKTILFVTHQLHYLKHCDEILVLSDGSIEERGKHEDLIAVKDSIYNSLWSCLSQHPNEHEEPLIEDSDILDLQMDVGAVTNAKKQQLELEKSRKDVSPDVYWLYIKSCGGWMMLAVVIVAFSISIGSTAFSSWWLKRWFGKPDSLESEVASHSSDENGTVTKVDEYISFDSPDFEFNRDVYAGLIGVILFGSLIRTIFYVMATMKACKVLHMKLLRQFFCSRIKTLERMGTGQVFNLFARDIGEVDGSLPNNMENFMQNIFVVLSVLILVSSVFPQFLVFAFFVFLIFTFYRKIYNAAIRDLKRIETRSKSPIFNRISETVKGLGTIRAFNKERLMTEEFEKFTDASNSVAYTFSASVRWLSIRLDFLAVLMTGSVAVFTLIFHGTISAAAVGLALAYAAQLSGVFQFTMRLASETEAKFVSVERIHTFLSHDAEEQLNIDGTHFNNGQIEAPLKIEAEIHPHWPTVGHVKFDAVTLSYSSTDPPILRDVSFEVQAGQNIGIIGRTGSGKSSIGNALFRLTELKSGSIQIDGVDISKIPLKKLRNAMCVISQDPCVFHKTIRFNLDAGRLYTDNELWKVLEKTGLKSSIDNLDSEVGLSHGQKQLLCIARALLRQSKIIFIDEATSNMDVETAAVVEKLLAEEFKYSSIFIVAHRTSALASCENLLMMEDGGIKDFGPIDVLSKKPEFKQSFEKFENVALE